MAAFDTRHYPLDIRFRDERLLSSRQLIKEVRRWKKAYPEWWRFQVNSGNTPKFYEYRFVLDLTIRDMEVTKEMIKRVDLEIGHLLELCRCSLDADTEGFNSELKGGKVGLEHWGEHTFAAFYDYIISYIGQKTGQEWFFRSFYTVRSKKMPGVYHLFVYQQVPADYNFIMRIALQTQNYVTNILENNPHSEETIKILREMAEQLMPRHLLQEET